MHQENLLGLSFLFASTTAACAGGGGGIGCGCLGRSLLVEEPGTPAVERLGFANTAGCEPQVLQLSEVAYVVISQG